MTKGVAIVTGAGSGIGRAVAIALSNAGWAVSLAGRRPEALEETMAGLSDPTAGLPIPTDVADPVAVDALFDQTVAKFGRVDVLFNNAGMGAAPIPLDELPVADLRQVIDVNLWGMMLCARAALRVMKAQTPRGGRIINNGSISAHAPRPDSAPYTTTKHAITGLTKSLILDGRAFDITAAQIDIGNAATDMTSRMTSGVRQANGTTAPEPRMDVGHVADMVVHMAALPLEVNVPFVTVMATTMPLYGRG